MSAHAGFSWRSRSPRLLWRTIRQLYYAGPLYRLALRGATPDSVRGTPAETWTGDSQIGHSLINGALVVQGHRISVTDQPWSVPMPSRPAFDHWQGFGWLRDLRAAGTEDARRAAKQLVSSWIEANTRWNRQTWQPDLAIAWPTGLSITSFWAQIATNRFARYFCGRLANKPGTFCGRSRTSRLIAAGFPPHAA